MQTQERGSREQGKWTTAKAFAVEVEWLRWRYSYLLANWLGIFVEWPRGEREGAWGSNDCQRGTGLHFGVAIGQFNSIGLLHNFLINSFSTHLTPHFDFCSCCLSASCSLLPTPAPRSAANGLDVINKPTINKYGQGGAQLRASTINNEIIFTKLASSLLGVRSFSRFPVSLFSRTQASEHFLWKTKTAAHFTPM